MDIMGELEKYFLAELVIDTDPEKKSLAPDEDLLTQGIIDSMGIMKLTAFMGKRFKIRIADEEIIPENFQTLNALAAFVEKKTKK